MTLKLAIIGSSELTRFSQDLSALDLDNRLLAWSRDRKALDSTSAKIKRQQRNDNGEKAAAMVLHKTAISISKRQQRSH